MNFCVFHHELVGQGAGDVAVDMGGVLAGLQIGASWAAGAATFVCPLLD
jgi:hypothetical protein